MNRKPFLKSHPSPKTKPGRLHRRVDTPRSRETIALDSLYPAKFWSYLCLGGNCWRDVSSSILVLRNCLHPDSTEATGFILCRRCSGSEEWSSTLCNRLQHAEAKSVPVCALVEPTMFACARRQRHLRGWCIRAGTFVISTIVRTPHFW